MENHLKIKSKTTYNIHIVSREKQLCFQESIGTNAIAHKFGQLKMIKVPQKGNFVLQRKNTFLINCWKRNAFLSTVE